MRGNSRWLHHVWPPVAQDYAAFLRDIMKREIAHPEHPDSPLTGLKVVVNPGNGGGGFIAEQARGVPGPAGDALHDHTQPRACFAPPPPPPKKKLPHALLCADAVQVLGPLGADVSASIYLEPGGGLPHRLPRLPAWLLQRLDACSNSYAAQPHGHPPPHPRRHADGSFPHHLPNPEDKNAVEATQAAVLGSGADLGIMLDTDVDRSGCVDAGGNGGGCAGAAPFAGCCKQHIRRTAAGLRGLPPTATDQPCQCGCPANPRRAGCSAGINRNRYIALMSAITLREHPGETIVTDSCTSNGLAAFIAELGGNHFRFKKVREGWSTSAWLPRRRGVPEAGSWSSMPTPCCRSPPGCRATRTSSTRCAARAAAQAVCHLGPVRLYTVPCFCCPAHPCCPAAMQGIELNKAGVPCPLMMETSGHGALRVRGQLAAQSCAVGAGYGRCCSALGRTMSSPSHPQENYFLDDGCYTALKVVIEMVKRRLEGRQGIADMLTSLR
jgi:hypothetical protein